MLLEYPPLKDGLRELTLVVRVEQPTANWIWECHGQMKGLHGVLVTKICEGDQTCDFDHNEDED